MRQIKFRGRKLDGTWLYGYYTIFEGYHKIWCEKHSTPYDVDGETVGEFTGLKDSKRTKKFPKGEEIYESDKVTIGANDEVGIVKCRGPYFSVNGAILGCDELQGENLIVIGNEHENPELI